MQLASRALSSTATSFFTGSCELEDEQAVLSDYVVGHRLGEGAHGSVYVVQYLPSGDRFALKILQKRDLFNSSVVDPVDSQGGGSGGSPSADEAGAFHFGWPPASMAAVLVRTFEQQIISEAMVMQSLEHPHVVKFYKFLNSTTAFYFVMELAEGGELFDLILSKNYFAEDEALMYFQQLISAIDYCHRNGVAHKDLKAENLLLSSDGRLLVCDFGFSSKISKENIDDPEKTLGTGDNAALLDTIYNGCMFGTLHYTSPEAVAASSQQRGILFAGDSMSAPKNARGIQENQGSGFGFYPSTSTATSSTCSNTSPSPVSHASSRSGSFSGALRGRASEAVGLKGSGLRGKASIKARCASSDRSRDTYSLDDRGEANESCVKMQAPSSVLLTTPSAAASPLPHSGSNQSLCSAANERKRKGNSTPHRLHRVGGGISTLVKSLIGSSGGRHRHRQGQGSRSHGEHSSPQSGKQAAVAMRPNAEVKDKLKRSNGTAYSPTSGEREEGTTGAHQLPQSRSLCVPSQDSAPIPSSCVSSTMSSPSTLSFASPPSHHSTAPVVSRIPCHRDTTGVAQRDQFSTSTGSPAASKLLIPSPPHNRSGKKDAAAAVASSGAVDDSSSPTPASHKDTIGVQHLPRNATPTPASPLDASNMSSAFPLPSHNRREAHEHKHHGRHHRHQRGNSCSQAFGTSATREPQPIIVDPFQQDLWSAGVILFFMLTGRLPFDGRDEEETLHLIQVNEFGFDDEEAQRISLVARRLVTQMLAPEPTDRPTIDQIVANPWFARGLQPEKDFPHRKDLMESLGFSAPDSALGGHCSQKSVKAAGLAGDGSARLNSSSRGVSSSFPGNAASTGATSPAVHSFTSDVRMPVPLVPSSNTSFEARKSARPGSASGRNRGSRQPCDPSASVPFVFLDFSTHHVVTAEEEQVLETAFRKIDSDGYGCITRDQLRDMLTTLHGDAVRIEDVDELVRLFTGNENAVSITFKQFRDAWVNKDLAHAPFTHSSTFQLANIIGTEMDAVEREVVRQLRTAFNSLDESHSGVIQLHQVQRVFEKCSIPVQREDCLSFMQYFHETEMNRSHQRASLHWQRWGAAPNTTGLVHSSGTRSPLESAKAHSLLPTTSATRCCSPPTTWQSTAFITSPSGKGDVNSSPVSPVPGSTAQSMWQVPDSPTSPSGITISFDSFVRGIVKSNILLKHPLGRKLAAATNLAALFQSCNVTECVRSGFLVTGLQKVVLAKLASMPERLMLLYSDEVVSNTENIYSFRYLGSSALVVGATMSDTTPLLMSSSLVVMAASTGSAKNLPLALQDSRPSQRRTTIPPTLSAQLRHRIIPVDDSDAAGGTAAAAHAHSTLYSPTPFLSDSKTTSTQPPLSTSRAVLRAGPPDSVVASPSAGRSTGKGSMKNADFTAQVQHGLSDPNTRPPGGARAAAGTTKRQTTVPSGGAGEGMPGNSAAFPCGSNSQNGLLPQAPQNLPAQVPETRARLSQDTGNDSKRAAKEGHSSLARARRLSPCVSTTFLEARSSSSYGAACPSPSDDTKVRKATPAVGGRPKARDYAVPRPSTSRSSNRTTLLTTANARVYRPKHAHSADSNSAIDEADRRRDSSKKEAGVSSSSKTASPARRTLALAGASPSRPTAASRPASPVFLSSKRNVGLKATSSPARHTDANVAVKASPPARGPFSPGQSLPSPSSVAGVVTKSATFAHRAMAYGGHGTVALVNGVCDVDVILSPACLGYTLVQFRRIHGKTSDFHEAVTFISNLLEMEREQAMQDTMTRGESELM